MFCSTLAKVVNQADCCITAGVANCWRASFFSLCNILVNCYFGTVMIHYACEENCHWWSNAVLLGGRKTSTHFCGKYRPISAILSLLLLFSSMRGRQQLSCPVLRPSNGPNARPQDNIQGGPAKVKPLTFLLVTFECIGKIQWFLAHVNYIQQQVVWCKFYANFFIMNT